MSLLQLRGPAPKFPLQWSVSNVANSRAIRCPDLPRTVSIYAKLNNDSCGQPAHMVWPHLALTLILSTFQPTGLLSTPPNIVHPPTQRICIIPSLYNTLPLPTSFFLLDSCLSCSLRSNITSWERPLLHPQRAVMDPLLFTPLGFFHSTYNKPHD